MRKYLATLTAITLLLTAPAHAFKVPEPESEWTNQEFQSLVCVPTSTWGKDHSKDNPVVRIYISAHFNPQDNFNTILEMDIIHELYYGERHNRSTQYAQIGLKQFEDGKASWGWFGKLKGKPQAMLGVLTFTKQRQWFYSEVIGKRVARFENAGVVFSMESQCKPGVDPNIESGE
jgi:hypothetical protein